MMRHGMPGEGRFLQKPFRCLRPCAAKKLREVLESIAEGAEATDHTEERRNGGLRSFGSETPFLRFSVFYSVLHPLRSSGGRRLNGKTDLGFALTRVTLSLRQLRAEPHTKEVGHDAVYYYHCLRSARRDDGGRGVAAGPADAGAAPADVR